MTARAKRGLLVVAVEVALVVGLHAFLLAWFADGEVASVLFTGGHDVTPGTLVGAALFFLVRLLLYLVVPGVVLAQLAALARGAQGSDQASSIGTPSREGSGRAGAPG